MAGERLEHALKRYRKRYRAGDRSERSGVLDEFCELTGYHRKYAISLLNNVNDEPPPDKRKLRTCRYSECTIRILAGIWKVSGYPWSVRLKAILPLWLSFAKKRYPELTAEIEEELLFISPRQMDRRLNRYKRHLKGLRYGRTKPGTLLKHQIPIQTEHWRVTEPGFTEVDLVAHCGEHASGEFVYSLNLTDIHSGWVETRAVVGKGWDGISKALQEIREALPFPLKGIDSDNGSEFINWHLYRLCKDDDIRFTRGRPGRKNDNAYVEQKNWTHVRKIFGWVRYDSADAAAAMNDLYRHELSWMMNLFQPSVKLKKKERVGSRLHREYDVPKTPLQRLVDDFHTRNEPVSESVQSMTGRIDSIDPFDLSDTIDRKLSRIECMQRKPVRQPVSESEPASIHSAPRGYMNGTLEAPHEAHSG